MVRVLVVSWEYPPVVVGGLGRHVRRAQPRARRRRARRRGGVPPAGRHGRHHPPHRARHARPRWAHCGCCASPRTRRTWSSPATSWPGRWRGSTPPCVRRCTHLRGWSARRRARPRLARRARRDHARRRRRRRRWSRPCTPPRRAATPASATPLQRQVHSVEWWLAHRADALITCSAAMRREVDGLFGPGARARHGGAQRHRRRGTGRSTRGTPPRPAPAGPPTAARCSSTSDVWSTRRVCRTCWRRCR